MPDISLIIGLHSKVFANDIHQFIKNFNWETSVGRTAGKFNMLPPDQGIEQTINSDQKGIIGISTSQGPIQRWVPSTHNTATLAVDFMQSLGLDDYDNTPNDLNPQRKSFDERSVRKCYDVINSSTNPFLYSTDTLDYFRVSL